MMDVKDKIDRIAYLYSEIKSLGQEVQNCLLEDMSEDSLEWYMKNIPCEVNTEVFIRELRRKKLPLSNVASFSNLMQVRARRMQLCKFNMHFIPIHEAKYTREIASSFGIRVPHTYQESLPWKEVDIVPGSVIKPVDGAGSRGVYIFLKNKIIDVKRGQELKSKKEFEERISDDIRSGRVLKDCFNLEEVVCEDKNKGNPARDLKFYSFYGRVPLLLETIRYPALKRCWWNRKGEIVDTGKYTNKHFKGDGVCQSYYSKVEKISSKIPAPFVRLDFLKSYEGDLVLGEISPNPADFDSFNLYFDRILGESYLDAEARMFRDIFLNGKSFMEYKSVI